MQLTRVLASLWGMRILRVHFAGLVALAVLVAGIFMAGVVMLTGLAAYAVQLLRGKARVAPPVRPEKTHRESTTGAGDVIDVEATRIPVETDWRP